MEQSSSVVQHQPFQLYLLRWEFQLDKLLQNDGKEDAGTEGRRNNCGETEIYSDEVVFTCSDKFLIRKKSDCIQKSGDTHSYGETWKQDEKKFKIRRSVEFSSAAARCILWRVDGHSNGETCRNKSGVRCGPFRIWTWSLHEEEVTERSVAYKTAKGKPYASGKSDCQGGPPKAERT